MNQPINQILGRVLLLALPLFLTSCDELIGELDNLAPSPVVPTPEPTPAKTYRVYTSGTACSDEPIPAGAVAVESSAAVTWSAGTYVVSAMYLLVEKLRWMAM